VSAQLSKNHYLRVSNSNSASSQAVTKLCSSETDDVISKVSMLLAYNKTNPVIQRCWLYRYGSIRKSEKQI